VDGGVRSLALAVNEWHVGGAGLGEVIGSPCWGNGIVFSH